MKTKPACPRNSARRSIEQDAAAGRGRMLHLKPNSRAAGCDCGAGNDPPWKASFEEAERQCAAEWYIAEYESASMGSFVRSLSVLREAFREYRL